MFCCAMQCAPDSPFLMPARGGESCQLTNDMFKDAINDRWLNPDAITKIQDKRERQLFNELKIAYQTGKGNHLVPVLFPHDTLRGLEILTDNTVRNLVGVNEGNKYIFANTANSLDHVGGWAAINKMCLNAGVKKPELLTATRTRHRISTRYAELDVPENDKHFFLQAHGPLCCC